MSSTIESVLQEKRVFPPSPAFIKQANVPGMVYGPIAAFLVELFPTKIRYTSMSLPYHIGNGWFGGMLPLTATALVAANGDIYYGLWYPIGIAVMTLVIGAIFLRETKDVDIAKGVALTK